MKNGMSVKEFFSLAFGSMVGIGWIISVPAWMSSAGSIGAIISVIVTMLLIIPIGFVYGELTSSLHVDGGEFAYTYKALGKVSAFICGWFLIMGYVIILPWVAISVSDLLAYMFPIMDSLTLYTSLGNPVYLPHVLVSFLMIGVIGFLNWEGAKQSSYFQIIATTLMIVTFLVFIFGGFISGSTSNMQPLFTSNRITSGIAGAIGSIIFFMNGFDTIPKAAKEANSHINFSNLGKSIVGTIIAGSVLYMIIVLSSSFIMPAGQLVELGELPLITAFENISGSMFLTTIVILGVLLGVITTFNGFMFAGSRLITSFSKAGFLPKNLSSTNPVHKTPRSSLIFLFSFSIIGVLLGDGLLEPLMNMGGTAFLIAWFFVSLSSVRLRQKHPNLKRPYQAPGGIYMGYIATVFSGFLLSLIIIPGTPISLQGVEYVLFIAWILIGLVAYIMLHNKDIELEKINDNKGA